MGRNRVRARSFAVKLRRSTLTYNPLRTTWASIPTQYALTFRYAYETLPRMKLSGTHTLR